MSEKLSSQDIDIDSINLALGDMLARGYGLQEGPVIKPDLLGRAEDDISRLIFMLPDEELRGNGSRRSLYLKPRSLIESAVLSGSPTPAIEEIGEQLEPIIQAYGTKHAIPLLSDWSCNKAVVNKIQGSKDLPGEIKGHTDPKRFSGAVVVLSLEQAEVTINHGAPRPVSRGSIEAFIGRNLSLAHRVKQPYHSIETTVNRYSVAFLSDTVPPLKLKFILKNAIKAERSNRN